MSRDAEEQEALARRDGDNARIEQTEFIPLPRRQLVLTLGGVMFGLFLAALDQTVVGTAMPRIVADLGGFDRFTWVTTAYLVASTTAVPIVGRLSDLYGRKQFYLAGIVVFVLGSLLAGLSQSMEQLIGARAVQGIGGGVLMSLAFVVVGDLFAPAERGKYQGIVAGVFGLSSVIGPTLGGFITDTLSWHWVFLMNLPLGLFIFVLFARFFPSERPDVTARQLDVAGMALLILAVVPLLVGLSLGGSQYEWVSPQVIGPIVMSSVMLVLFVAVEMRAPEPIMPLEIYRNRIVSVALFASLCTGFGMFGAIIFVPLFFQGVLGASATSSGTFLTPMMLGIVVGATISGQALSRLGGHYRVQGLVGVGIMASGLFLVSRMTAGTGFGEAVVNIVIMGFGLGTTFPTFTIAVQNAVPHSVLGVVTSGIQFYRTIGGSLGLAILGSVMASRFSSGLAGSIPRQVEQALPRGTLSEIAENPQALVNPDSLDSFQTTFAEQGPGGAELAEQFLQALRETLATSIADVFVIAMGALLVAFVAVVFLKERPLRGTEPAASEAG